jgi:hypothetical protein
VWSQEHLINLASFDFQGSREKQRQKRKGFLFVEEEMY